MSTCESAEDLLLKANVEFLDKNYKGALEQYNLSIELDDKISDTFVKRAMCFEKLKRLQGIELTFSYYRPNLLFFVTICRFYCRC
jgi:hypothetical protein